MTVGGHHRCEGVVDQPPALALHLRAVAAEQAAAVDLERPTPRCKLVCEARISKYGLGPLRMCDDRRQAGARDPFADLEKDIGGAQKRNLDEHVLRLLEHVSPWVVVEERRHRRQLEAEPELERHALAQLGERPADPALALFGERQGRRNMWRRRQPSGPPLETVARQGKTLGAGINAMG